MSIKVTSFDHLFFSRYTHDEEEIIGVIHKHPIVVIDTIAIILVFFVLIPSFIYMQNVFDVQEFIAYRYLLIWLFITYSVSMYHLFNWYNDSWIVTKEAIVTIDWSLFRVSTGYVEVENIHGIEVDQDSWIDGILGQGTMRCVLAGDQDNFILTQAHHPHDAADFIREVQAQNQKEPEQEDDHSFETLQKTLASIIQTHLSQEEKEEKVVDKETLLQNMFDEEIEKLRRKKGTIDLRSDSNEI